jgi:putative xylitol transport system ATP-binding protein
MLEVRNLECPGRFGQVDFKLHAGEILGIYGLLGAGRSEFLQALFGLEKNVRGEILRDNVPVAIHRPRDAMRLGMAFVTEDRKNSGLVLPMSLRDNLTLSSLERVSTANLFINSGRDTASARDMFQRFRIKAASLDMPVSSISGGNQQKVVLGRWINTRPKILLLDEPTRGIDEGAKHEIYQFMTDFVRDSGAIIMVSSEIDEVLGMSDRIQVFRRGLPSLAYDDLSNPSAKEDIMHMTSP